MDLIQVTAEMGDNFIKLFEIGTKSEETKERCKNHETMKGSVWWDHVWRKATRGGDQWLRKCSSLGMPEIKDKSKWKIGVHVMDCLNSEFTAVESH